VLRIDGQLVPIEGEQRLMPPDVARMIRSMFTEDHWAVYLEKKQLDFSFSYQGLGRFRGNAYQQRGAAALALRGIPYGIKTLEDLKAPAGIHTLLNQPYGLVLCVGPTGSGKSTTLAAMIDEINETRACHILTIEDPIEYLHTHKKALVNQRELHADTHGFNAALRAALREDPDVVLVGEMRDLETMEAAMKLAETGHLTMATLHTNSAAQTITRIVDAFPAHQQSQIRTQLSLVLEGIVCQALLPKASGSGRVAGLEILTATPAIRNLIRDDKIHQIYGTMQAGQEKYGMQTMNQSLARHFEKRNITKDVALATSSNRDELQTLLERGVPPTPSASTIAGAKRPPMPLRQEVLK
jgi:twitching motility protein PilT